MASNVFVTHSPVPPERWLQAFPEAIITSAIAPNLAPETLVWLHNLSLSNLGGSSRTGVQFIVLHDEPSDEKGLAALSEGAAGYANAHATPQLLHTIESVVRNHGLWVGETLLNRLTRAISMATTTTAKQAQHPALAKLSERERDVATRVAHGESNKEVARDLNITERTVKAHLTAVFEKLGVRDRLQLAVLLGTGVA